MSGIRDVPYNQPGVIVLGIEALTVEELKRRAGMKRLSDVQRIKFFLLLLYTEGVGEHMVDFVTHPVTPNTLMLVKPGQVQQFHLTPSLAGQLIVVDPSFLLPEGTEPGGPPPRLWWSSRIHLPDDLAQRFLAAAANIAADSDRYAGYSARVPMLQHQLYALLWVLRLFNDGAASEASGRVYNLVMQFKRMAEDEYSLHRTVPYYAQRLGCAERTLTRACQSVEGRSAKDLLDARILLEAKRLLAHGRDSVAVIAYQLGFTETTNFVRFFKTHERVTPAQFRDRHTRPYQLKVIA